MNTILRTGLVSVCLLFLSACAIDREPFPADELSNMAGVFERSDFDSAPTGPTSDGQSSDGPARFDDTESMNGSGPQGLDDTESTGESGPADASDEDSIAMSSSPAVDDASAGGSPDPSTSIQPTMGGAPSSAGESSLGGSPGGIPMGGTMTGGSPTGGQASPGGGATGGTNAGGRVSGGHVSAGGSTGGTELAAGEFESGGAETMGGTDDGQNVSMDPMGGQTDSGGVIGGHDGMGGDEQSPMGGANACEAPCLPEQVTLTSDGGRVVFRRSLTFLGCRTAMVTDQPFDGNGAPKMCQVAWDGCALGNGTVSADIRRLLDSDPVAEALAGNANGQPKVYGRDARPVDGSLSKLIVGDQSVLVGGSCDVGAPIFPGQVCVAPPNELVELIALLYDVQQQTLANPACVDL